MTRRMWLLPFVVLAALGLAWLAERPPAPRPATDTGFSAVRAMALVERIAAEPHVTGSAANTRVRDFLLAELRRAGLSPELQRSFAVRQSPRFRAVAAAPIENVVAVLSGRDRSLPAVALMSHYDSVPFSPGAGDDASGTAAALETARLLARGPQPLRDVVFLFTDGEELGLLGAQAFFTEHPLRNRVAAVVNVEARGSSGRATMFQTSAGNAALVSLWARHASSPAGNSLTDAVYQRLPNDTDLSVALDHGRIGINAAFIAGQFDYHSPTDSPANLDRGSLQHLGDFAHRTTRALAFAEVLPSRGADTVYFDLFGLAVVRYPPWAGWVLLGVAALGVAAVATKCRRLGATPARVALGLVGLIAIALAAGAVLHFLPTAVYGDGATAGRELLAEMPRALWVYSGIVAGLTLLAGFRAAGWIASMILMLVAGAVAQAILPGGAYIFVWPLLAAIVVALVALRRGPEAAATLAAAALVGGTVFALVLQLNYQSFVSVGAMTPAVLALAAPFAVLLLGPLLHPWSGHVAGRVAGLIMLAGAAAGALWLARTDGFSPRHPRSSDLFSLTDADSGRSYWASWSGAAALPNGAAPLQAAGLAPFASARPWWGTPAPAVAMTRPTFAIVKSGSRASLRMRATAPQTVFAVALRPTAALMRASLNGRSVQVPGGEWTIIRYGAVPPPDLKLSFDAAGPGSLELRYLAASPGLPAAAPRTEGQPSAWTRLSGSRAVTGTARLGWRD